MSVHKYAVHQRSRKKKYVATYSNGDEIQADTKEEFYEMMKEHQGEVKLVQNDSNMLRED